MLHCAWSWSVSGGCTGLLWLLTTDHTFCSWGLSWSLRTSTALPWNTHELPTLAQAGRGDSQVGHQAHIFYLKCPLPLLGGCLRGARSPYSSSRGRGCQPPNFHHLLLSRSNPAGGLEKKLRALRSYVFVLLSFVSYVRRFPCSVDLFWGKPLSQ